MTVTATPPQGGVPSPLPPREELLRPEPPAVAVPWLAPASSWPAPPVVVLHETVEMTSGADASRRPEPPAELFGATEQLTQIAELLEAGDVGPARSTLYEMPIEQAHWYWMNASTLPTHRHEGRIPAAGAVSRDMRLAVGSRDRWHCRYCGLPVADVDYFNKLSKALPTSSHKPLERP